MKTKEAIAIYNLYRNNDTGILTEESLRFHPPYVRNAVNAILKTAAMVEEQGGTLRSRQIIAALITTAELYSHIQ